MRNLKVATVCLSLLPLAGRPISAGSAPQSGAQTAEKTLSGKALQKYYSKTVQHHVKAMMKEKGAFVVQDDKLSKDWRLKLLRIHTDRIVSLGEGKFFACADLKEVGGHKTPLDLDFFVSKQGGQWVVDKVQVHKVNGQPRYTYNDNNEQIPVP